MRCGRRPAPADCRQRETTLLRMMPKTSLGKGYMAVRHSGLPNCGPLHFTAVSESAVSRAGFPDGDVSTVRPRSPASRERLHPASAVVPPVGTALHLRCVVVAAVGPQLAPDRNLRAEEARGVSVVAGLDDLAGPEPRDDVTSRIRGQGP